MDPVSRRDRWDQTLGLNELVSATSLEPRSSSNEDSELELHYDKQREQRS